MPLWHPDDNDAVSRDPSSVAVLQCSDDICQPQASDPAVLEEHDSSEKCTESSLVIVNSQTTDSTETDTSSTVSVIQDHQNKDSSVSGQTELDCASADVAESVCHSFSSSDRVPESKADLYMCCSDDDLSVKESCSHQQGENARSSLTQSQNGTDRISNNRPAMKRVVTPKQRTAANGTDFLHDHVILFSAVSHFSSNCCKLIFAA